MSVKVNDNCDVSREIGKRIEKTITATFKLKKILCNKETTLKLKIGLVRCYIFSTFLYGANSWTLTDTLLKKLESFEMWVFK